MFKFVFTVFISLFLFGCASTDSFSELEARVSNLESADRQTNKEIETLVLNQVDIQHSIEEFNTRLDRGFKKSK